MRDLPTRNELLWVGILTLGMALLAVERGWQQVCWNVGLTLVIWVIMRGWTRRLRK